MGGPHRARSSHVRAHELRMLSPREQSLSIRLPHLPRSMSPKKMHLQLTFGLCTCASWETACVRSMPPAHPTWRVTPKKSLYMQVDSLPARARQSNYWLIRMLAPVRRVGGAWPLRHSQPKVVN